jgi:hypothetical protein
MMAQMEVAAGCVERSDVIADPTLKPVRKP